ncbi:MAG: FAD-dependent oxidoreductase, partial [Proteobacteria bacterium]|nr:FAD-dependent oxidoreductase [Pseudomonadota bacterium]
MSEEPRRVVIVGGGFAGLNAARVLGRSSDLKVTLVDRRNHHLFQPLLYQVAMAGLSPAEIAAPIRSLLSRQRNTSVRQEEVRAIDPNGRRVLTTSGPIEFDYLILASGARDAYFGNDRWEAHAPGLKSLEQATEIRRRVLTAYERAETETDPV